LHRHHNGRAPILKPGEPAIRLRVVALKRRQPPRGLGVRKRVFGRIGADMAVVSATLGPGRIAPRGSSAVRAREASSDSLARDWSVVRGDDHSQVGNALIHTRRLYSVEHADPERLH
jgi:hypothetical protein